MRSHPLIPATLALLLLACTPPATDPASSTTDPAMAAHTNAAPIRFASYNVALNEDAGGGLLDRLRGDDAQARRVAAIIQHVRPDIVLVNEFDYDAGHAAAELFQSAYLARPQHGQHSIDYPHRFLAPVNTGVPSGMDLDGDGRSDGPGDAWGYGEHPGQYGMLLLSRFPIDEDAVRTFQNLPWSRMPDALEVQHPDTGAPWYHPAAWEAMPLSSKSHWDVPVDTPLGRIHVLAAHPTPPVFDGPENRNGRRNHDEIRLWAEYIGEGDADWLVDDAGVAGRLDPDAAFVILGDYNADPLDGDSVDGAIHQLLEHPRVLDYPPPASPGGAAAGLVDGALPASRRGDPAHHTGNFGGPERNLRVDYVLPSRQFRVDASGVHWPLAEDDDLGSAEASDHHAVWVDLSPATAAGGATPAR